MYIDFEWICNQWTHCFKNLQWPTPQLLCYSQMKHLWQVPQNFRCLDHELVSYLVQVIYSYSSHFDWLVSSPFHRKCPVSVVNVCLEIVHAKTVLNEGCASFAWVSHIKCCKCRDYSVVVMLCWYARVNVTTRLTLLDLDPSPSIIIILYHMRQLQVTQNLP